ncbi:MAG: acyl-ACP--UDP-N-acetylglucosamine O-acyltransferase [Phycisphaerales bacterium]|jgi:UDP-N-acetylglucosamine acyltransferase|nr:acyl-ACP--UDP-N-acetylglucosamine O-acyltransferase [Phycisphaerales bacterium]
MTNIHTSSIIEGDVQFADDVTVGPFCHLIGPITIGAGTKLISGVHIHGPCTIGKNNLIYPGVCLGFAPQDYSFDCAELGSGLVIGDSNTFREHVSIHRATDSEHPSTVGNHNYLMEQAHIAHDVRLGNHITIAGSAHLAGHCWVDDKAVLGGLIGIHQFCRIGRGSMVGACLSFSQDLPPFFSSNVPRVITGINRIGMRRMGMSVQDIRVVREVFNILYRQKLSKTNVVKTLKERDEHPIVTEYIEFIETSRRGYAPMVDKRKGSRYEPTESPD